MKIFKYMKKWQLLPLLFILIFSAGIAQSATDDLWDISQGAYVTLHSPVLHYNDWYHSDIRNMFGGEFPTQEVKNTLFADYKSAGTLHWVEWTTADPVTIKSFVLTAAHDGSPRDANYRGFSRFTLYRKDDSDVFVKVFEIDPANPYGNTPVPPNATIGTNDSKNLLSLCANIDLEEGQEFRAEFVQFGDTSPIASGPRIVELDGFETSCPGLVVDADNDGVVDDDDFCPDTSESEVVDLDGCSVAQLCPCDGPFESAELWMNHGMYVSCTAKTSEMFVDYGLISYSEKDIIVSEAAQSSCGAK